MTSPVLLGCRVAAQYSVPGATGNGTGRRRARYPRPVSSQPIGEYGQESADSPLAGLVERTLSRLRRIDRFEPEPAAGSMGEPAEGPPKTLADLYTEHRMRL